MHRKLRHFISRLSVVLVMVTGVWLGVPKDVCLTKAFTGGCICPTESVEAQSCVCCDVTRAPAKKACCDNDAAPVKTDSKSAECFSLDSGHLEVPSPERIYIADIPLVTLSILPLHESLISEVHSNAFGIQADDACLDRIETYRENCVYLI